MESNKQENKTENKAPETKSNWSFLYAFIVWGLYNWLCRILFFVRIEGRENIPKGRNCVLMGNHQHIFDPLMLAMCVPDRQIHFMGKKELWNNKLLGWAFTKVHGFPVDRGNIDMVAIRTAMNVLKDGSTLGIFPEGTRSTTGHMLPLLGGAAMLSLRAKVDVIPVYIDGNYKLFRPMTVRVGKPIDTADLLTQRVNKDTCDELTRRIEGAFARLSGGKSLPAPKAHESEEA